MPHWPATRCVTDKAEQAPGRCLPGGSEPEPAECSGTCRVPPQDGPTHLNRHDALGGLTLAADPGHDVGRPENRTALLAVALELRAWALALPLWDSLDADDWDTFLERRRRGENALAARLRRLPGCSLGWSEHHNHADLTLAGVRVQSDRGLKGACEAWVAKARDRKPFERRSTR